MNIKLCYCVDATVLEEEEKLIDLLTYLFLLLRTLWTIIQYIHMAEWVVNVHYSVLYALLANPQLMKTGPLCKCYFS